MTQVFELRIFLRQEYSRYALPEVPGVIKLCRDLQFPSLIYVAPLLAITFFVEKNCNWGKALGKISGCVKLGLDGPFPFLVQITPLGFALTDDITTSASRRPE